METNINHFQKSYEIICLFVRLQSNSLAEKETLFIETFLKHELNEEYSSQHLKDIVQENLNDKNYHPDSSYLKVQRFLEYLDHEQLKLLFRFIEVFLNEYPRPNYYVSLILLFCGRLLQKNTGLHITEKSYPKLFILLNDLDAYESMQNRLEVTRSQAWSLAKKTPNFKPIPLSEFLTQITLVHCCYHYIKDDDLSVYNILIKFARRKFAALSFQQVTRISNSIQATSAVSLGAHLFFIEQIHSSLTEEMRKELVVEILKIKQEADDINEDCQHFIGCLITACHFNVKTLDKILFFNQRSTDGIEAYQIKDINPSCTLAITDHGSCESNGNSKDNIIFEDRDNHILAKITHDGKSEDKKIDKTEEFYFKGFSFLVHPEFKKVAYTNLNGTGLVVSKVDLAYKGNNILTNISMKVQPGEMIAMVGPSGCGKSTMLTMLSGILEYTKGDIYFNGERVSTVDDFSKISTYIPQDDILFRELTVTEAIESSLRLKIKASSSEYQERLETSIDVLGLERTRTLKIGNEGEKGISGGQRKRVNIGTTIVADMKPILLFDEPTSGLDPATDLEIMQLLRELSRKGHIVLCVTHNLSDESMGYFDKLMVLGASGKVQFFGKKTRAQFFFGIKSTQILFQKMKDAAHINFNEKFMNSFEYEDIQSAVTDDQEKIEHSPSKTSSEESATRKPSLLSNMKQFLKREAIRKFRDKQFLLMCCLQPILIGLFINWNFSGPFPNAIFSLITATLWIGAISGVREINGEMAQLKRDYMYGSSLFAYLTSKTASCLAFSLGQVLILANFVALFSGYFLEPYHFSYFEFILSLSLLNLFGVCLGLLLSASIKSTLAAIGILPVLLIPLIIMGGALIQHDRTSGMQRAAMTLNPLRISFESVFYSSKTMLRPLIGKIEKRTEEKLETQKELWEKFQTKLNLFNTDPEAYKEKYTEADVNDIFADMLSDEEATSTEEIKAPTPPADVVEPKLLIHKPQMWLDGLGTLDVDHPEKTCLFSINSPHFFERYDILAPEAFSEDLSVQGALGMYEHIDGKAKSIYSPAQYSLYIIAEILFMFISMLYILKTKLSSKF